MNPARTDIDIDFADRDKALEGLEFISASIQNKDGSFSRHPSGVYFQDIPVNPYNGLAAFEYATAEEIGYFKIDFLNQSVYNEIRDEDHLSELMATEPLWELLDEEEMVKKLIHIHNHYEVVKKIKPRSVEDLAVVLALIRPGKKHLLNKPRSVIDVEIWKRNPQDKYAFRKAHAISYAALIVVQMNLIVERISASLEVDELISFS